MGGLGMKQNDNKCFFCNKQGSGSYFWYFSSLNFVCDACEFKVKYLFSDYAEVLALAILFQKKYGDKAKDYAQLFCYLHAPELRDKLLPVIFALQNQDSDVSLLVKDSDYYLKFKEFTEVDERKVKRKKKIRIKPNG
jgi:hypothetical protein